MTVITVNGKQIDEAAIANEAQHHPAASAGEARQAAALALTVRELLLQEARRQKLSAAPVEIAPGKRETEADALIRALLDREIDVPEADEESLQRYYDNNRQRFCAPDLYEAAHILIAASPEDTSAYEKAVALAAATITTLQNNPERFATMAAEMSACSSAENGGRLGQIARGDTVPEFETFLCNLEAGQLCPVPVKTRYGAHVLRLDRRIDGHPLPFEAVRAHIGEYLAEASWRRAVAQYIRLLAGSAVLSGIDLDGAESPLVQ